MTLLSLNRTEVIICEWPKPLKSRYYKNLIPEISVTKCGSCFRLFHTDDYELAVLQEGHCPFCRRENLSYADCVPQDYE
uniref:Uncharacterized protein n=1 Tax=Romanomermis culicivorax TaxID=13658 RepID=A0A915KTZ5_ROMCU